MAKKRIRHIEGNANAEFSRLFWAARKEQNQRREKATANDPEHKAAVAFAEAQGWPWAVELLAASCLDRTGAHDKTLEHLAKVEASIPEHWQGLFYFVRGAALGAKGEHEEAIKGLLQRYPKITIVRLLEELRPLGYRGSYTVLRERVKEWRAVSAATTG